MFKVPGAFKSVGVDQAHGGLKVTYIDLEARTWRVDVQATAALEYFDPVFPLLKFVASFLFWILYSVFLRDFPGSSPPGFDVAPAGWGTMSIPRVRFFGGGSFIAFWYVFATAWGFAREVFDSSAFDPSAFAFCYCFYFSA